MINNPIRVLHIVSGMERAGLETMIMNYYRYIDRSRIQFDFLEHRMEQSAFDEEIEELGGRIYRVHSLNPLSLKYRNEIDSFFQNHQEYSIVHCHMNAMAAIPLKYAKKNGIPIRIAHAHNTSANPGLKYLIKAVYRRLLPCYATELYACGKKAGNWSYGKQKYNVINNAIPAEKFIYNQSIRKEIRKRLGIENKIVIGHVGRFSYSKNHMFLVDTFREILKKNEKAVLLLVGKGELENEVKEKVKAYHIDDKVIFYGISNEIYNIMNAMDIFVLPSIYEGFPVTIVEAQASGLRCVISNFVSSEVDFTGQVIQIDLSKSVSFWAETILNNVKYERKNMYDIIVDNGFDVCHEAKKLENKYFELLGIEKS